MTDPEWNAYDNRVDDALELNERVKQIEAERDNLRALAGKMAREIQAMTLAFPTVAGKDHVYKSMLAEARAAGVIQ